MRRILRRLLPGVLAVLCLLGLGAALHRGAVLQHRRALLEELEQNRGSYDSRSIVLQDTGLARAQRLARRYGAELRITGDGSYARLTLPEDRDIEAVIAGCMSLGALNDMSPDYRSYTAEPVADGPADPECPRQTYLETMNMENVWELTRGSGILVAVIDTGIDTDHPAFAGRISSLSYNATEDKTVADWGLSVIEDTVGHGTAVAGVLAAGAQWEYPGVAPEAELVVIKAQCDGSGQFIRVSDLVFGLYYAIEQGIPVVNMSFCTELSGELFEAAARLAWDSGILCVASAGNEGTDRAAWPAAASRILGVGALSPEGELAAYSNYADNLDLVAPGNALTAQMGGGWGSFEGTSFACPRVSGALALVLGSRESGQTDPSQLWQLLFAAGKDLGAPGRDPFYGFGETDLSTLITKTPGTLTLDPLTGGSGAQTLLFFPGIPLQALPCPREQGKTVESWCFDRELTRAFCPGTDVLWEDTTLYARWQVPEEFDYRALPDGTAELLSYRGSAAALTLPDTLGGLPVTVIGAGAFRGCDFLEEVRIPAGVTVIREEAFRDATALKAPVFAPDARLETVEDHAFAGCAALETVALPASLKKLSATAFLGTTGLQSVTVAPGNGKFIHIDGALFNASGDTLLLYPAGREGRCTLPEGTERIGDYAFAYGKIETVELTGVKKINEGAFMGSCLKELVLPDTVDRISREAFAQCARLTSLQLGSGITVLPEGCFRDCVSLEQVSVPPRITRIYDRAFSGAGVRELTFRPESKLRSLGEDAFRGCPLESLTLPPAVESVGAGAFWGCAFTRLTLPASLVQIGAGAFGQCPLLEAIAVEGENPAYASDGGALFTRDGRTLHTYPGGRSAQVYRVPETVERLEPWCFAGSDRLEQLILPQSLEELTERALQDGGFRELTLPQGLTRIGDYALAGTHRLEALTLPHRVTSLGRYALWGSGVREVTFGAGLTRVGDYAFAHSGLEAVTVPGSVTDIGVFAFAGCPRLERLTFGQNSLLERLPGYLVTGCPRLRAVTFLPGSALVCLGAHSLEGAPALTLLDLGDAKLQTLGSYAFSGCRALETLTLPESVTAIGSCAFPDTGRTRLYFAAGTLPPSLGEAWDRGLFSWTLAAPALLPGDANGDGQVTYQDALEVLLVSVGIGSLSPALRGVCDMDGNGELTYTDALRILQLSVGLL